MISILSLKINYKFLCHCFWFLHTLVNISDQCIFIIIYFIWCAVTPWVSSCQIEFVHREPHVFLYSTTAEKIVRVFGRLLRSEKHCQCCLTECYPDGWYIGCDYTTLAIVVNCTTAESVLGVNVSPSLL